MLKVSYQTPELSNEENAQEFTGSEVDTERIPSFRSSIAKYGVLLVVAAGLLGATGCESTKTDSAAAALAAMPAVAPSQTTQSSVGNVLQKGDEVDVYVLEDESFNGRYMIRESGDIILPKVGRVQVAGRSTREAERMLKARLELDQLKMASVLLERTGVSAGASRGQGQEMNRVIVYVTGFVLRPGRAVLPEIPGKPPTLLQAIAEAGGFARFANQKSVAVLRRDGSGATTRTAFDVVSIQKGKTSDISLQGGDVIVVNEKTFGF